MPTATVTVPSTAPSASHIGFVFPLPTPPASSSFWTEARVLPVAQDFSGANGTLPATLTDVDSGGYQIQAGQLQYANGKNFSCVIADTAPDGVLEVDYIGSAVSHNAEIEFHRADSNNRYFVSHQAGTGRLELRRVFAGVQTFAGAWTTGAATSAARRTIRLVIAQGQVEAFVDGISYGNLDAPRIAGPGNCGLISDFNSAGPAFAASVTFTPLIIPDLRVYEADGATGIPFEVVNVDAVAKTWEVWVKGDVSILADTDFVVDWDGVRTAVAANDPTFGSEGVWADYDAVYHGDSTQDATGNGNTLTAIGGAATGDAGGILGTAFSLDSASSQRFESNSGITGADAVLLSAWFRPNADTGSGQGIVAVSDVPDRDWQRLTYQDNASTNPLRAQVRDGSATPPSNTANTADTATAPTVAAWNMGHAAFNTSGHASVYLDGANKAVDSANPSLNPLSGSTLIGAWSSNGSSFVQFFDGLIDEVPVRASIPTAADDWVQSEHSSQSAPNTFATWADDAAGPELTFPTGTTIDDANANLSVVTDTGDGDIFAVVTRSAKEPSRLQIENGQNHNGSPAEFSGSIEVTATGAQFITATGLPPATTLYGHFFHLGDTAGDSEVVSTASFETDSASAIGLAVANLAHAQSLAEPAISVIGQIGPDKIGQVQAVAQAALLASGQIGLDRLSQIQLVDVSALVQTHVLDPEGLSQAQALQAASVAENALQVFPGALGQSQLIDDPALLQFQSVSADSLTQSHLLDAIAFGGVAVGELEGEIIIYAALTATIH